MTQRQSDAVLVHVRRHVVRRGLGVISRIAHRHANLAICEHRDIIAAVTKGDRLLAREAQVLEGGDELRAENPPKKKK